MADDNRGWHGDPEGHRDAARDRREDGRERKSKTNWWPLLFLPVAFVIGWAGGDASDNNNREQAYTNQTQPGVGGGPDVSITPGAYNGR